MAIINKIYRNKFIIIIVNFNLIYFPFLHCQSKAELENQKNQTILEIKKNNELIEKVHKRKESSLISLSLINNQVKSREELLKNIDGEISLNNTKLNESTINLNVIKAEIFQFNDELKKSIYNFYKLYKQNVLMLIFSSKNINDCYKRISFFKQIKLSFNRKQRVLYLKQINLNDQVQQFNQIIKDRENLQKRKIIEIENLSKEKNEKETLIVNLSKKEKELYLVVVRNKKVENELERKIIEIASKEKKKKLLINSFTPEELIISKNFESNKGKLPWPTERGTVTGYYGKHEHQVLKGVFINNNGIDITTENNSIVRSIFDGIVTKIFPIKGCHNVIILRHGNFLTVYQNVNNIQVKMGQKVKIKQTLGYLIDEDNGDLSTLHLEIWEELKKQDPLLWLSN